MAPDENNGRLDRGRFEGEVLARLRSIEARLTTNTNAHEKIEGVIGGIKDQLVDLRWRQKGISAVIAAGVSGAIMGAKMLVGKIFQ